MAAARRRGTYSVPEVIDFTSNNDDDGSDCDDDEDVAAVGEDSTTSPVTMPSLLLSPVAVGGANVMTTASMQEDISGIPKSRKTGRQASAERYMKKKIKVEDDDLYKTAFKAATTLASEKINIDSSCSQDSVRLICDRLNQEYGL